MTNVGTLIATVSGAVIIAQALGYRVDNDKVKVVIDAVCGIGLVIGVLNNKGGETPKFNK